MLAIVQATQSPWFPSELALFGDSHELRFQTCGEMGVEKA